MDEDKESKAHRIDIPAEVFQEAVSCLEKKDASPEEAAGKAEESTAAVDELESLRRQLEEKTKEAEKNNDKFLRMAAELENFRKRVIREKADIFNFGNEKLLREILPVLDALERAIESAQTSREFETLLSGVQLTANMLRGVLRKFDVVEVEGAGTPFDPNVHEAVMQEEAAEAAPDTVLRVHQKGYKLKDRLLRPAMVSVAKRVEKSSSAEEKSEEPAKTEEAAGETETPEGEKLH